MDPIATFQGTVRTISLGWAVPAYSNEEAKNNLTKMSKLISMCYPIYSGQSTSTRGAGQISGAPLIKLRFANLIASSAGAPSGVNSGLLGWIDGITFSPNLEAGFYDPSLDGRLQLFPKQIDLNCQFHALHEHKQGWSKDSGKINGAQVTGGGIRRAEGSENFPYGSVSNFQSEGTYPSPPRPNDPVDPSAGIGPRADTRNVEPWMDPDALSAEEAELDAEADWSATVDKAEPKPKTNFKVSDVDKAAAGKLLDKIGGSWFGKKH